MTLGKAQAMRHCLLLVLLCVALLAAGCGMVDTYEQRERRISNMSGYHARMFVDDSDVLWHADRVSYLSYWHLRETD